MDFGNREKAGKGTNYCALDFSSVGGKVNFYKVKEGSNKLDVVPYVATSNKHPLIMSGRMEKGSPDYDVELPVHRRIGANNGSYICPNRYAGLPCPICEAADELKDRVKAGDVKAKKTQDKLFPSWRIYMNVVDMMDEDKGVQLFETNNMHFMKPLKAAQADFNTDADAQAEHPKAHFADPDNGLTIKFLGVKEPFENGEYNKPTGTTLLPRKNDMNDYLEDAIALDKCIKVLSYEELEAIFTGAVAEDEPEEEEETPAPKVKKAPVEDDEEPAPKKPAKKASVEEEDETPKSKKVCGFGYRWYKDNDTKPECEDCKQWKYCCKDSEPK